MSKPILSLLLCGALLPVVVAGCGKGSPPEAIEIKTYPSGWKTKDTDYVRFRAPLRRAQFELAREMDGLQKAGDYAAIEKRVAEYRRTKEEFLDGTLKLHMAYTGLSWMPGSEADWRAKHQLLQQWRKKHPQSLTAQIALATSYYAGCWFAINSGHDPAKRDQLWRQRDRAMVAAFIASYRSGKTYLEWFILAQESLTGSPASRKAYDRFVLEAVDRYGNLTQFHLNAVLDRTQQKGGKPGQWQAYAAQIADQLKGEAGDRFYARAVWHLLKQLEPDQHPDLKTFDWPRAKRGFELLMNKNPQNPESVAGPYAVAAWHARDRETLKLLFEKHIDKRIDGAVWATTSDFLAARRWAVGKVSEKAEG